MVERDTNKSVEIRYEDERTGEVTRNYSDISKAQSIIWLRSRNWHGDRNGYHLRLVQKYYDVTKQNKMEKYLQL